MSPALGGMINGIKGATKAAWEFIRTPIGAILAGIALAVGALTQYFRDNEEGQNKLTKITNGLSAVFGVLTDIISNLGKTLFEAFENPQQALIDFGNLLKENVINRFVGFVDLLSNGKDIIANSFEVMAGKIKIALADVPIIGKSIDVVQVQKDIDKATNAMSKDMVEFANNAIKASTGIDDAIGKTANAYKFLEKTIDEKVTSSNAISDKQAQLDKDERKQLVSRAKLEVEIANLRLKAKDEANNTDEERLVFLKEASRLTDEVFKEEERLAQSRFEIKQEENKLANSTKDDLKEEAELESALIRVQKQRADGQRRIQTEITTAQNKTIAAGEKELALEDKKLQKQIDNDDALAILKLQKESDSLTGTREKADAEIAILDEKFRQENESLREKLATENDIELTDLNAKIANQSLTFASVEELTYEHAQAIIKINNDADKEIDDSKEKIAEEDKKRIATEKKLRIESARSYLTVLSSVFQIASDLAGDNFEVQKALSIGQAIINTAQGVTQAYAQGGPLGLVTGTVVAAAGAIQIAKIAATKPETSGTGGGGTPSISAPTSGEGTSKAVADTSNADQAQAQNEALEAAIQRIGLSVSVTEITAAQVSVTEADNTSSI